jgi:aspartate/methionine/tyrosine aminotransferase
MSSFSKIFSVPGFRMGYAIAHPAVVDKLTLSLSTQLSCLSAFTQLGCVEGLKVIDRYTADLRDRFRRTNAAISELVNRSNVMRCAAPAAGFYVFVDISAISQDDMDFCQRLLEERYVAITPGRSFGAAYSRHVRLATCGRYEDVQEGVMRLIDFAQALAPAKCA